MKINATMLAAGERALCAARDQHPAVQAAEVWEAMEAARLARIRVDMEAATKRRAKENRPWNGAGV
jgi:hypothetical protein